jgi:hypothetical protein
MEYKVSWCNYKRIGIETGKDKTQMKVKSGVYFDSVCTEEERAEIVQKFGGFCRQIYFVLYLDETLRIETVFVKS